MKITASVLRCAAAGATVLLLSAPPAFAQRADLQYGRWWPGGAPVNLFALTYQTRPLGPFRAGLGIFHADDSRSLNDRTNSGGVVSLYVGGTRGLYGVGSFGIGVLHTTGNADAHWSAGLGYTLSLFSFLAVRAEAGYRVEDQGVSGFWNLGSTDRKGFVANASLAIGGGGGGRRRTAPATPAPRAIPEPTPGSLADDVSDDAARTAEEVVESALSAMGTPYSWGGSDANGYDCSGLIQWAYGEHGVLLPRTSRDQARTGMSVDASVAALRPGDILTFNVNGNGVSHVGLYVGDGEFIHSSSTGVRLSSLTASDPDSRWWQARWAGVRRVLQ